MNAPPKLIADGIGLRVGDADGRWLVRNLTGEFAVGTVTAIVGPNGSGKSTLLRCLCGLEPPREGRVVLGADAIESWPGRQRARTVAYLPQSTPLVHALRVRDVVALGRAPYRARFIDMGRRAGDHVTEALTRVQAVGLADRLISTLSGGERQRVMIARMLATGATHLLMDEPTSALDVGHALSLHGLVRTLASQGRSVVIAMHDLDAARRLADVAICLDRRSGDGGHHRGPADSVLGPEVLAAVFGVSVREVDGALRFELGEPAPR